MEKILEVLKSFEPLGIFSNNLEEFLTIQLKTHKLLDNHMKSLLENLSMLANENISSISKNLILIVKHLKINWIN